LTCADNPGSVVLLDQRKRLAKEMTSSEILSIKSKMPATPKCITGNVKTIHGIMSIYSKATVDPIPKSTFILSSSESRRFHGSLFDHPGCSLKINVNTAFVTALCQIYKGSGGKRKRLAEKTVERRKLAKIVDLDDLSGFISTIEGELDESAMERICF